MPVGRWMSKGQRTTIMSTANYPCLRETVRLGISERNDFSLRRIKAALLIVDVQRYCCDGQTKYYKKFALPRMTSNIQRLLQTFRQFRDSSSEHIGCCEVIFTALQSQTMDGRDLSLDYKLSGPFFQAIPKVNASQDDIFFPELQPNFATGKGDIYIPKTASSVFHSTNIDYILRNLNVEQLVIVGQITEQCVESTVRNAADMGYFVTLVEDACSSHSQEKHNQGLAGMNGYCRIVNTQQIIDELEAEANKRS